MRIPRQRFHCLFTMVFVLGGVGLGLQSAIAGVVSMNEYSGLAASNSATRTNLKNRGRVRLRVALDLSGYRDAAVSFDFTALMRRGHAGFETTSASGGQFTNGIQLLDPLRNRYTSGGAARFRAADGGGFRSRRSRGTFSTAMFNLAAYDGQTVVLLLEFNRRHALRRGVVNIDNLKARVIPSGPVFAGTSIPEPGRLSLFLLAFVGVLAVTARGADGRRC